MYWMLIAALLTADHRGVVLFGGLPVPGASIVAQREGAKAQAITDAEGRYQLRDLSDGDWTIRVEMQMFQPAQATIRPGASEQTWNLELATPPAIKPATTRFQKTEVSVKAPTKPARKAEPDPQAIAELQQRSADGLLINGSVNNGIASSFAQMPAFGNNRRGQRTLYNGNLGLLLNRAAFDARPFSITGQDTPKPAYGRLEGFFNFGGPLVIPGWIKRNGPQFSINYQWVRATRATTQSGLVPTADERSGILAGVRVPQSEITPQAKALLDLYPLPNFTSNSRFNFQAPVVNSLHQDDLQTRINKQVRKNFFSGAFAWQSRRTDQPDLFGYLELGRVRGWNSRAQYRRTPNARTFANFTLEASRLETDVLPFFANRRNVSAEAGIRGNDQAPQNWGPPSLSFASGFTNIGQSQYSAQRNQTIGIGADAFLNRGRHNWQLGYTLRSQQFNENTQQDARGSFAFTGSNDFEKFLRGLPDASSISFGNADKYLRGHIHEAFVNDDWRVNPGLTINWGLRWEYWTPLTEKYGRLANLTPTAAFASATASVGNGALRPDRNNIAPRLGISWRPMAASSMVIRAGYGIYYDTSVYQAISLRMAQQAPLATSYRLSQSPLTPLTLADGFSGRGATLGTTTNYGVDPNFRIGYNHTWQVSLQRDLPWALQMTATYLGQRSLRAQQQSLPNTYPDRAIDPTGFTWLTSNGNGTRHSGQIQLRRRLRNGLAASLGYTWAKSLDNSRIIAQNWLDLAAEKARSNFDQRHNLTATLQYTTAPKGVSRLARLTREWTLSTQWTAGTGLPLTPILLRPVLGTGVTGTLRPDLTGAPLTAPGLNINPAAFRTPANGSWGNAGRNIITGPSQFSMNASLARAFRSSERLSYDLRIEATNVLNTVTFPTWNTVLGNLQFGLPNQANPMRGMQIVGRMRF